MTDELGLKPGVTYTMGSDGKLVEVPPEKAATLKPVPNEDLPPDLQPPQPPQLMTDLAAKLEDALKAAKEAKGAEKPMATPEPAPKVDVTDEKRFAFVHAVLDGTPYEWTYDFFDGKLAVTFRTLSVEDYDAVSQAIVIVSNRIPYAHLQGMSEAHIRLGMASALVAIRRMTSNGLVVTSYPPIAEDSALVQETDTYYVKGKDGNLTSETKKVIDSPGQRVLWAGKARLSSMPAQMFNIVHEAYDRFLAEVGTMTKESADPDFFT